jgi:hypothetical protein
LREDLPARGVLWFCMTLQFSVLPHATIAHGGPTPVAARAALPRWLQRSLCF